jgi:signal transduction histidine kinase
LKHMRERVEKVGGTLVVDSQPGQGTEVRVVLPLG